MTNFVEIKNTYPVAFKKFTNWVLAKFPTVDKIEGHQTYLHLINNEGRKSKMYPFILKTFATEKNFTDVEICFQTLNNNN